MNLELASEFAKVINAIGLLIVGGIGAWIALEQRWIAKQRLAVDLFDKRYDIYQRVVESLLQVEFEKTLRPDHVKFAQKTALHSKVLFPKPTQETFEHLGNHVQSFVEANARHDVQAQEQALSTVRSTLFECIRRIQQDIRP
jgi:hypothetical protein